MLTFNTLASWPYFQSTERAWFLLRCIMETAKRCHFVVVSQCTEARTDKRLKLNENGQRLSNTESDIKHFATKVNFSREYFHMKVQWSYYILSIISFEIIITCALYFYNWHLFYTFFKKKPSCNSFCSFYRVMPYIRLYILPSLQVVHTQCYNLWPQSLKMQGWGEHHPKVNTSKEFPHPLQDLKMLHRAFSTCSCDASWAYWSLCVWTEYTRPGHMYTALTLRRCGLLTYLKMHLLISLGIQVFLIIT